MLAGALAAALVPAAPASATVVARYNGSEAATARYWTAERMAAARPLDVVRGGRGVSRLAPNPPPFTSFQVPDPTTPPNTTQGKVFGLLRGFGSSSARRPSSHTRAARLCSPPVTACTTPVRAWPPRALRSFRPTTDGARPFGALDRQQGRARRRPGSAARTSTSTTRRSPSAREAASGSRRSSAAGRWPRTRRATRPTTPSGTRRTSRAPSACGAVAAATPVTIPGRSRAGRRRSAWAAT